MYNILPIAGAGSDRDREVQRNKDRKTLVGGGH